MASRGLNKFPWIKLIFLLFLDECLATSRFTQPLGISGKYLTTSIGIGSPPQHFDVALSINDDSFFLFDYSINNEEIDYKYNYIKNMFVPERSGTCEPSTNICRIRQLDNQKQKSAFGTYTNDYISLGITMYGLPIHFCKIDTDRSGDDDPIEWLFEKPVDGFLGLGLGFENPLSKIRASTGNNQITLWLDRNYTEPDRAGLITFGGPNYFQCSQTIRNIVLDDEDSWMFFINSVTFNTYSDKKQVIGMFDLASDTLTVPPNTFQGVKAAYGGDIDFFYCQYYNKQQKVTIEIYGLSYDIDLSNFVYKVNPGSDYCKIQVEQAAEQDEIQIILGKQILKQYCVTFNYDNYVIGLAESKK